MYRKTFISGVVLFSVIVFTELAFSSVVGMWEVHGTVTARVTIRGYSASVSRPFSDKFTFEADGDFSTIEFDGT